MEENNLSLNSELINLRKQLLESEKMASLGQLSAGIAHEIKNPLNFINNFSKLTIGLIDELQEIIDKISANLTEDDNSYLSEVMADIRSNLQKIDEHGQRAERIITGMLLHSRGKSGELIPTDINSLLAEYLNLAYHAIRARDVSFNIRIETAYDDSIGKINVVPQDLSRVFLNLINNACYATNEKKKQLGDAYFPLLTVKTKKIEQYVEISITDNGIGMSAAVREKLFTAFFTTKPPGEGTGLGLKISHDIIVNTHKGTIGVKSEEGLFTEFLISIPIINPKL
ncbi:MAG TPA: ATP-binding protein [Bacteroidales bacterium]|nr:ATP-binding protein [Bacteroidales bacterium]